MWEEKIPLNLDAVRVVKKILETTVHLGYQNRRRDSRPDRPEEGPSIAYCGSGHCNSMSRSQKRLAIGNHARGPDRIYVILHPSTVCLVSNGIYARYH